MTEASSLRISGVSYVIGGHTLLDGVDAEFRAGEVTALSGPSGSGKTTLLSVAGGLLEPTSGTTAYAGASMWRGTGDPRPEVAFVLQVYGLVPILSARENVSVALRARGAAPADADEQAEAELARFHIADLGDRQVEELSGGQMQRVALARGFAVRSGVLLADEPTSELDETNRGLVLRELRAEAERGAVVVVATHDPAVVDACDGHLVIDEGRLTDHVAPVDVAAVSEFYAHGRHRALADAAAAGTGTAPTRPDRVGRSAGGSTAEAAPTRPDETDEAADGAAGEAADEPASAARADREDADAAFRRPGT